MKTLLNSAQRDAVSNSRSECPLMAYVRATFTTALRNELQRFRPTAEDICLELYTRIDRWRGHEGREEDTKARYAGIDTLLADLECEFRDLSPEYPREDCQLAARAITAMLMALFSTQRAEAVAYVHISNSLFAQLYNSFREETMTFTAHFAPQHGEGLAAWLKAYLLADKWISHEMEALLKPSSGVDVSSFRAIIQHPEPDRLLRRLHELIDGRRGADVGAVLLACRMEGYITRNPTEAEFRSEFHIAGGWSAVKNYMNDNNENALDRANKIIIF